MTWLADLIEFFVDADTAPGTRRRRWLLLGTGAIGLLLAVWLWLHHG